MQLMSRTLILFFGTIIAQLAAIYAAAYFSYVDFAAIFKVLPIIRTAFLCTLFSLMLPEVILSISKGIWEENASIIIFFLTGFIACIPFIVYPLQEIDGALANIGASSNAYLFSFLIAWPIQGLVNAYHVTVLTRKQASNNSSQPTAYGGG